MKYQDNRHFSHDHFLLSLNINNEYETQHQIHCDGCKECITDKEPFFHGCTKCDYHLHDHCFQAPRCIQHQSHPLHPLSLLSIPTYSSPSYLCDACGGEGDDAFSYVCAHCGFDIHLKCSLLSHSATFNGVHPHELTLKFDKNDCGGRKEGEIKSSCDVCDGDLKEKLWLYYCGECDFAVHLDCVCVNGPRKVDGSQGSKRSDDDDDEEEENKEEEETEANEEEDEDDEDEEEEEEEEVEAKEEDDDDEDDEDNDNDDDEAKEEEDGDEEVEAKEDDDDYDDDDDEEEAKERK